MDINVTLFGQAITFALFVWFTMNYVWPPLMAAMQAREKKIADGLASAQRGEEALEQAEVKVSEMLQESKAKAAEIIEHANARAHQLVDESKEEARVEGKRLIDAAHTEIELDAQQVREGLRADVASLALNASEQILGKAIDINVHNELLDELAKKL